MLIDLSTPLLGPAELTPADIIRGIESKTATLGPPAYEAAMLRGIAEALVARAREFGWRVSIIAGQEMHETRWFRYGGDVPADALNVAGIGATGGVAGARFPRPDAGHPAVCAHHAAYHYGAVENWPAPVHSPTPRRGDAGPGAGRRPGRRAAAR